MATTPAVLTAEQQAQLYLHQQLSALAQKHVTVSYTLIGALVLLMLLLGAGGYIGLKFADKQLARAEASEQRFQQAQKDLQSQITAHDAQRSDDTQKQNVIVKVVHDTDTSTDAKIAQVLQPKTAQQALSDLDDAYGSELNLKDTPLNGNLLSFPVTTVQQFSASKLDRDRLSADLNNYKGLLTFEQDKTKTLTADLGKANGTLTVCQQTVEDYKKAAKVGRLKKFLHAAGGTAVTIGAAVFGFELGHRL